MQQNSPNDAELGDSYLYSCIPDKSQDLFYKIFEASPILMAISTIEEGVFIDVNKAWIDALGYKKEDVIGKSALSLNIFLDYQERQKVKHQVLQSNSARNQELKYITKEGVIRYGIFSADIITLNNKEYLLTSAYDVTERKKIKEIEAKNKQLKERLEYDSMKAGFLANISHELKTPVNIIFSSLQLLDIILKKESLDEVKTNVQKQSKMMRQNCYRLIRQINNLIDITKVGSGYLKLNLSNCDIVNLLESITISVAEYSKYNGIDMYFNSEYEEFFVACDVEKVERIVLNLLSNAIKFTPRKGQITVNVNVAGSKLKIAVRDTGVGIPKTKQLHLFKRFYQANNSLLKNNEGSGIGLSLAKSLAELHEGDLYLNKQYINGSEFVFELPIRTIKKKKDTPKKTNKNDYIETINVEFSDIYFEDR